MVVSVMGQFCSAGLNSVDIRIVSHNFKDRNSSSFKIFTYYFGYNNIYSYTVQFSVEKTNCHVNVGIPTAYQDSEVQPEKTSGLSKRNLGVCKLIFLKSYRIPFPICFLTSVNGNLWAISQDRYLNLKGYINDDNLQTHSSEDIFPLLLENDEHMDLDASGQDPLAITDSRIFRFERNPICCITSFIYGLVICRENKLENCWTVEVLKADKMAQTLLTVPFVKPPFPGPKLELESNFHGIFESKKYPGNDCKPHMTCIATQLDNQEYQGNLVSKSTFISLFGAETLILSNTVLLIGLPDGRILWNMLLLPNSPCQSPKNVQLLCNIEQPICGIHIVGSNSDNPDGREDMVLIVGLYGKVMILEPSQQANITENTPASFTMTISHIPSPVCACAVNSLGILHTSTGGQLWMSSFSIGEKQIRKNRYKCIILDSKQLDYINIMQILHLPGPQGASEITLCVTFDGSIYAGNFFEQEAMGSVISEEEIPILLKSIYQYSDELQQLELLAQKQRKLFSALATAANLKFQATRKIGISCSLIEMDTQVHKFLINVVFNDLNDFNLCTELWSLTASVSSSFHKEETTVSRTIPLSTGKYCIEIEVAASLFISSAGLVFPLVVEAGLLLSLPEEWEKLSCFTSVIQNLPVYIRIQTVKITELCVLKSANAITKLKDFSPSSNNCKLFGCENILHSIWNVSKKRAVCNLLTSKVEIKAYKFPYKFCFYIFLSSAELILKAMSPLTFEEDFDVVKEMMKYICAKSCNDEITKGRNLLCLGYPVSIHVKKEFDSLCITVETNSFQLLVGLKLSIIKLLMANYSCALFPSNRKICIASKMYGQLQDISASISKLMCQDRTAVTAEELELYKMLRKEISSNLYLI